MSDTQYPHVQAAFINAIREEGTKAEACDALQRQWNRACAQAAELTRLQGSLDQMAAMWSASQDLLAASKEVGFQFDELTRLERQLAEARDKALEEAAKACDRRAGNASDFDRYTRKAAGMCAADVRALKEQQP